MWFGKHWLCYPLRSSTPYLMGLYPIPFMFLLTQKMSGKMLATHSSKPNSKSKQKQPKMWLLYDHKFYDHLRV